MSDKSWIHATDAWSEIGREIAALSKRRGNNYSKIQRLRSAQRALWTPEIRAAREEYVLAMRDAGHTFRAIATELGVTVERARQIHGRAEHRRKLNADHANL